MKGLEQIQDTYDILEKLHEGGMGSIVKVKHRLLGEVRVVKTMLLELLDDDEFRKRFSLEARVAASLKHPNIAHIHDFMIDEDGVGAIVMEFIDGISLKMMNAARGSYTVSSYLALVLEIARQSLRALEYLHHRGYIHRDISPDNILLTKDVDGRPWVKLIDLGIAKKRNSGEMLTIAGQFLGKLRYASPEHFDAQGAGGTNAQSDIYCFGLVLYELLTGEQAVVGNDFRSLSAGHIHRPPRSFEETDPKGLIPGDLRAAVMRSLRKEPETRYESAKSYSDALSQVQKRHPLTSSFDVAAFLEEISHFHKERLNKHKDSDTPPNIEDIRGITLENAKEFATFQTSGPALESEATRIIGNDCGQGKSPSLPTDTTLRVSNAPAKELLRIDYSATNTSTAAKAPAHQALANQVLAHETLAHEAPTHHAPTDQAPAVTSPEPTGDTVAEDAVTFNLRIVEPKTAITTVERPSEAPETRPPQPSVAPLRPPEVKPVILPPAFPRTRTLLFAGTGLFVLILVIGFVVKRPSDLSEETIQPTQRRPHHAETADFTEPQNPPNLTDDDLTAEITHDDLTAEITHDDLTAEREPKIETKLSEESPQAHEDSTARESLARQLAETLEEGPISELGKAITNLRNEGPAPLGEFEETLRQAEEILTEYNQLRQHKNQRAHLAVIRQARSLQEIYPPYAEEAANHLHVAATALEQRADQLAANGDLEGAKRQLRDLARAYPERTGLTNRLKTLEEQEQTIKATNHAQIEEYKGLFLKVETALKNSDPETGIRILETIKLPPNSPFEGYYQVLSDRLESQKRLLGKESAENDR